MRNVAAPPATKSSSGRKTENLKTETIKAAMDGWDSTDEILGFKKDDEEDIFKRFGEDDEDDKKG